MHTKKERKHCSQNGAKDARQHAMIYSNTYMASNNFKGNKTTPG